MGYWGVKNLGYGIWAPLCHPPPPHDGGVQLAVNIPDMLGMSMSYKSSCYIRREAINIMGPKSSCYIRREAITGPKSSCYTRKAAIMGP